MKICVNLIATRKYHIFAQPLIDSVCKYFLLRHTIEINLFTDNTELEYFSDERVSIVKHKIPSYGFPEATLFRFSIMKSIPYDCDYIVYMDVDMKIVSEIGDEILNEITVTHHPGFYANNGWGSPNIDKRSTAYFEPELRREYVCGGFNLGSRKEFLKICHILANNIDIDEENGVRAEWNDESHLNALISRMADRSKLVILDSSYCQPEQEHLQIAWKIDHLPKRIIALSKDHNKIRS